MKFFRWIFFSALVTLSLVAKAGDCELENSEAFFDSKTIEKKGVILSDLFKNVQGSKVRIKNSEAMRFDANYMPAPADNKPFNLPFSEIKKHVDRAHAVLEKVKESQAFTTALNGKNIELPIGIKKTIGNKEIIICLDSIVFTPTYGYAVLYAIIEDTKNDKKIAFWGKDIRFTRDGGFTGDARLELLQTYDLQFGKSTTLSFLVDATHQNFVVFNCDGFKHLHVDARVFFSRDLFLPENPDGTIHPTNRVTADFMTDIQGFDDWLVEISNVPKFQVVGLEGVSFQFAALAFDRSSLANPNSIVFPAGYSTSSFGTDPKMWEGFYIKKLTITLPKEFKLKNSTQRISMSVDNAVIDKLGFTGKVAVQNLMALGAAKMGSWDYSLDYLSIDINKSTPTGAEFRGQLKIPISKETETFEYNASIQPNKNYNFVLKTKSNLNFPLWGAGQVEIYKDSWIKIALVNGDFTPSASLTGKMSITASINGAAKDNNTTDKNSNLTLAEISFQKLLIKSTAPVLSLDPNGGAVSFGSPALEQKCAKLPVSITKVGMVTRDNGMHVGFNFTLLVNLVGEKASGGGFSGSADITVLGENNNDKWSYYKTELNRIELNNIKIAVVTLGGYIEFYREDPVYGSGFSGGIKMQIDLKASVIAIDARCIFGKKPLASKPDEIYRYWAVDVLAKIPAIPMFPGIIYLNTFGGGASYAMRMDNKVQNAKFVSNSGVSYVPDENIGLGLKALIGIQGQTRKAYEGQIIFEIEFNKDGGLSQIAFSGYVQIASLGNFDQLTKLKSSMGGFVDKVKAAGGKTVKDASQSPDGSQVQQEITRMAEGGALLAQWRMVLDNNAGSFMANIDIFVDVAGVIKGTKAYGNAGRIDILFTSKEWHVFVGQPRPALSVTIIDFIDLSSYFMMGKNIPSPLPMPNGKSASFPSVPVDGMGIGARLHFGFEKTGTLWFKFGVDAGFDMLIYNVGTATCNGKQKGVKGWYGSGQAFVYGYAGGGLKECANIPYPCCHCSKKCGLPWKWSCDICHSQVCVDLSVNITLDIYAIVEAANPTYVEANVGLLGGKVNIPVKLGKRC